MAEPFTLDTSGAVEMADACHPEPVRWGFADLSPFEQGYVEALFAEFSEAHHKRPALKVGDKVRVHTEETGAITKIIPGKLKCIQVLFPDGRGGQFFPFECSNARLGFSDLHPETIAAIRSDCAAFRSASYSGADTKDHGDAFWFARQTLPNNASGFPPLTPFLDDEGRVRLRQTEAASQ